MTEKKYVMTEVNLTEEEAKGWICYDGGLMQNKNNPCLFRDVGTKEIYFILTNCEESGKKVYINLPIGELEQEIRDKGIKRGPLFRERGV